MDSPEARMIARRYRDLVLRGNEGDFASALESTRYLKDKRRSRPFYWPY